MTNREFNVELRDRTSAKFRSLSAELEYEVWIRSDHYMHELHSYECYECSRERFGKLSISLTVVIRPLSTL